MKIRSILFMILIFMISILTVNAGSVKFGDTYLYDNGPTGNTIDGITYDSSTNTMTFKNFNNMDNSYPRVVFDGMGEATIVIDGANYFYGCINSTSNLTIKGINNGEFNVATGEMIGSNSGADLTINDLTINMVQSTYASGLGATNVVLNNVSLKGYSDDSFGIIHGTSSVTINNSNLVDMGSYYHYGDMAFIMSDSGPTNINNSTITIHPLGYDKDFSFLHSTNIQSNFNPSTNSYEEVWFDGNGIISGGKISITDSNVSINGKRTCLLSNSSVEVTNSNVDLQCYYGIQSASAVLNSGNVNATKAITGVQLYGILQVNGGELYAEAMDDDTKAAFINFMENDSNESRRALEDINQYTPYQIGNIQVADGYGVLINGVLEGSGDPDDIIPSGIPGYYIRRGDKEAFGRLYSNYMSLMVELQELYNNQNANQARIDELENQILPDLENQALAYLIEEQDVDPNKLVIEDIKTLHIKRTAPDPQTVERILNVPKTGIVTFIGASLGVVILAVGAYLLLKSKESKKSVI